MAVPDHLGSRHLRLRVGMASLDLLDERLDHASEDLLRALGSAALEALHAAARVDQLLAAGVEGVAVGADLHADLGRGRARRELVAARTTHVGLDVLGMDFGLHGPLSVAASQYPRAVPAAERTARRAPGPDPAVR